MELALKKRLGLHIRLQSSMLQLIEKAAQLQVPFFQCFLVAQTGKLITVTRDEVQAFLLVRRTFADTLFCHGSYWINLASLVNNGYQSLEREIALAKRLEFTHFIVHAGTAKGAIDKSQGIDALAFSLNTLLKKEKDITIVLENTCHGNLAIGSDILDFNYLLEKLEQPERIGFCIDTSHAHAYGYEIADEHKQNEFITFLDTTVGIDRIKLIHLNDTVERLGSRIDRHGIVGEGKIGKKALRRFIMHPRMQSIPLVMELPELSAEQELLVLEKVRGW
jgi:deoxyribonuclease IV